MGKNIRVGIVTLHGYFNYGNKLQNYALKRVTEKLGVSVDTTVIEDSSLRMKDRILIHNPKSLLNKITKIFKRNNASDKNQHNNITLKRSNEFKVFSERFLSEKFYDLNKDSYKLQEYSYFITGSDQVWNPVYYFDLPIYFLSFTNKHKRIAYAPSISRDKLPWKFISNYRKWLNGMNYVSVREEAGAKIIKDLTGLDTPVLVDPTMLLTKEEWLSISKRASNRPDKSYILTYFLGGPSDETRRKIEKLADEKNMAIINLGDITEKETYVTGPSEFLDYINNASVFFTDSFHGVVFSIIFQTPFIAYERLSSGPSMYSRIETLLDMFDIRDRENSNFNEDIFSMNFSGTQKILELEYEKSINYLKKALKL